MTIDLDAIEARADCADVTDLVARCRELEAEVRHLTTPLAKGGIGFGGMTCDYCRPVYKKLREVEAENARLRDTIEYYTQTAGSKDEIPL